jgi:hypothetical protein
MSKQILKVVMKCSNAGKGPRGTNAQFANNIEQTDKGPAAREVVVVNVLALDLANALEPMDVKGNGKDYEITITEL